MIKDAEFAGWLKDWDSLAPCLAKNAEINRSPNLLPNATSSPDKVVDDGPKNANPDDTGVSKQAEVCAQKPGMTAADLFIQRRRKIQEDANGTHKSAEDHLVEQNIAYTINFIEKCAEAKLSMGQTVDAIRQSIKSYPQSEASWKFMIDNCPL